MPHHHHRHLGLKDHIHIYDIYIYIYIEMYTYMYMHIYIYICIYTCVRMIYTHMFMDSEAYFLSKEVFGFSGLRRIRQHLIPRN